MSNYRRRLLAAIAAEEDDYFYICHSSTGIIEKLPLTNDVYWPSLISANSVYGGLYSDWAGKGDYARAIENGEFDNLEFVDGKLQDVNYNSYNGDTFAASNRFVKGKAYTSIQTPEKNKIYYICEPKEEYFKIYGKGFYENNIVDALFSLITIDSSNYNSIESAVKIVGEQIENTYKSNVSNRLVVQDKTSGETITITPSDLDANIQRGYLGTNNISSILVQNTYYELRAKITTLDGYVFYYSKVYIYTGDLTTDTFKVQDYPFDAYYIYHTSNNTIERKRISEEPIINFPAIASNKYGGVFTDYGGKGSIISSESFAESFGNNDTLVDNEGTPYVGENNSGTNPLLNGNNLITSSVDNFSPEAGVVYYLKENPTYDLLQYLQFSYSSDIVTNIWLMSVIDSLVFNSIVCKFKEKGTLEFENINVNVVRSVKLNNQTFTAYRVFKSNGVPSGNIGYICYTDDVLNKFEVGKTYVTYFEATTADGNIVHSDIVREITRIDNTKTGFSKNEYPFDEYFNS